MKLEKDLNSWLLDVEKIIEKESTIANIYPEATKDIKLRIHGKKIRSKIFYFISKALGILEEKSCILAASIEMIHNASIFHDDVVDNAKYRRKEKTMREIYGNRISIMAGDLFFSKAIDIISELNSIEIYKNVNRAVVELASGHFAEEAKKKEKNFDLDRYFYIVDKKTGSLFHLSFVLPGILAKLPNNSIHNLKKAGILFGRIFQAFDDLLDIKPKSITGKDRFRDIAENNFSLPYILLLKKSDQAQIDFFLKISGKNTLPLKKIIELLEKNKITEQINDLIDKWNEELLNILKSINFKNNYKEIFNFCTNYSTKFNINNS